MSYRRSPRSTKIVFQSLLDGAEPASPGKFRKSETWRLVLNLTGLCVYRDLRQIVLPRPTLALRIRLFINSWNEASRPKSPQSVWAAPGACPPPAASRVLRDSRGAARRNHAGVPCEERRG